MKAKEMPTAKELHEIFEYRDGNLYWKIANSRSVKIGDRAGSLKKNGYTKLMINGKFYFLHRLIYVMFKGKIENNLVVDHMDGNPSNNCIDNLQAITPHQNQHKQKLSGKNTSGFRGVSFYKNNNKWGAQIHIYNKKKHLGLFDTKEAAAHAYDLAAVQYHGLFAQLNYFHEIMQKAIIENNRVKEMQSSPEYVAILTQAQAKFAA